MKLKVCQNFYQNLVKNKIMLSNTFGKKFNFTTWGESHGKIIGCVVDGVPSKIALSEEDIQGYLNKRRPGQSKFTTQRKEKDKIEIFNDADNLMILKAWPRQSLANGILPTKCFHHRLIHDHRPP